MVALGLGTAVPGSAADGDPQAEIEACRRSCDAAESSTDQATCRIQCEEKSRAKDAPDVIRWERTELRGGSPDPAAPRGSTTTITTVTPRGTTTRVEGDGPAPPASSARRGLDGSRGSSGPPARLAQCQTSCAAERTLVRRETCRARCLRDPWSRTVAAPSRSTAGSSRPAVAPSRPAPSPDPGCHPACERRASTCRDGCTGSGSDAETCRLTCDQLASRCRERCG